MKAKWVVDIKEYKQSFEISVLRDDNEHGKRSYGWFDENKLLISSSGGPCKNIVKKIVWEKLVKVAQEVADELNHPLTTFT
jgi:hypothetical protein